jgi:hypothetical protein
MSRASWFLILVSTACMGPEVPDVVTGAWGGVHLGLVATGTGAELEYDCATGRIGTAVRPDGSGRFSVGGFHFPGHGGPIRTDEEQVQRPARYDGTVRGDRMTITVTLTDTSETIGTFTLVRGATPHVFKCL